MVIGASHVQRRVLVRGAGQSSGSVAAAGGRFRNGCCAPAAALLFRPGTIGPAPSGAPAPGAVARGSTLAPGKACAGQRSGTEIELHAWQRRFDQARLLLLALQPLALLRTSSASTSPVCSLVVQLRHQGCPDPSVMVLSRGNAFLKLNPLCLLASRPPLIQ